MRGEIGGPTEVTQPVCDGLGFHQAAWLEPRLVAILRVCLLYLPHRAVERIGRIWFGVLTA